MPPGGNSCLQRVLWLSARYLQLAAGDMGGNGQSQGYVHRAPSAAVGATPSGRESVEERGRVQGRAGLLSWASETSQKTEEHEGHVPHTRQRDPSRDLRPLVDQGR